MRNRVNKRRFALTVSLGCAILVLLLIIAIPVVFFFPVRVGRIADETEVALSAQTTPVPGARETQVAIPTLAVLPPGVELRPTAEPDSPQVIPGIGPQSLSTLYDQLNPGVVNIQVYVDQEGFGGQGAGSGFVLDDEGHIITNNHVVAKADQVNVIFYNGLEADAQVVGRDPNSDLAVIRVDELMQDIHPLPIGDSDEVGIGEWVVAIGNPFGLGSSMSVGIVSAVGRTIPTGVTPFSIPQAIQTDAAINPGNSGGPLLNLQGEVVGVNAQIVTGGAPVNTGVGFAIPANIVRRVAPVLIETGSYQWPWLGVEGGSVNLAIMDANDLDTQQGAYINQVIPNSPAERAGLRSSSGEREIGGLSIPVGGDVVIEADGKPVADFSDLLADIASKNPGDAMDLTIIRDGRRRQVTVILTSRPSGSESQDTRPE